MSTLNASLLPENILTVIMSYIDSLSELKECRLVCKAWSNPGLTNMLGQKIVLQSDSGMLRLYDILSREPSRAHLIKHLRIEAEVSDSIFLRQLLRLALTPSIETIQGEKIRNDFFNEFNMIIKTWPQGFKKLRLLPTYDRVSTKHFSAIVRVGDSLERLTFQIAGSWQDGPFYDCFELVSSRLKFKNLTSLSLLIDHATDLPCLETVILKTCPFIVELEWYFVFDSDMLQPPDVKSWIESSVEKQQHLKTLRIQERCPTDYLQYFLHKYPNAKEIHIDTVTCDDQTMTDLKRQVGLIEKADPSKRIFIIVDPRQQYHATIECLLREYKYKIDPRYDEFRDCMELVLYTD